MWFVFTLISIVLCWFGWDAYTDWKDRSALEEYFAKLEAREPDWKDRVYGKPLTPQQMDDHARWDELQRLATSFQAAWPPYRQGLYGGMYQDPAAPEAMPVKEQLDFINAAHQFWQPVLQKLAAMKKLPAQHRYADRDMPYEKTLAAFQGPTISTAYIVNEASELEVMYHLMKNDPEQAIFWLANCRSPVLGYSYAVPSLVERCLNLTQPSPVLLMKLQQVLQQQADILVKQCCIQLGSELRLMEKQVQELCEGRQSAVELDRLCSLWALLPKDSMWYTQWFGWARYLYLKYRLAAIFHRPNRLILRLHQLADRIEQLPGLEATERWATWMQFAEQHSLPQDTPSYLKQPRRTSFSDEMPEGLYLIRGNYLHLQVRYLFEMQAQVNTAMAAAISERFRLDQSRFPRDWSELVPQYIEQPILDPFSGKPLALKQVEKGLVIYSLGHQGKDDGGMRLSTNHYWIYGFKGWDLKNTNVGTRVYLPAYRRGPERPLEEVYSSVLQESTPKLMELMKEKAK